MAIRSPRLPLGLVYDTATQVAAESNERRMGALYARVLQRRVLPRVAAGCVAEAWRGVKQPSLLRFLDGCDVELLTADHAKRAGALRRGVLATIGPVDATVVETAIGRGGAIVTADRADIEQLAASARRRAQIIDI